MIFEIQMWAHHSHIFLYNHHKNCLCINDLKVTVNVYFYSVNTALLYEVLIS